MKPVIRKEGGPKIIKFVKRQRKTEWYGCFIL